MDVKQVDVRRAHELQSNGGYTYIDVRSVPEYEKGHPTGAHNVPLLHFDSASGRMQPNQDFLRVVQANYPPGTKLLIGCQVGGRSSQAAQILASSGYSDVSNVVGGFGGSLDRATGQILAEGWLQANLPVETVGTPDATYSDLQQKISN
jgi:rhodanese-related sulfurtransferase